MDHDNCGLRCLTYLEELFDAVAYPEDVAACIIEPVQMDGGVNIAPDDYLPALGRLCNDRNILLIADEVYTGFGKTGKFFAIEHWGVQPDIMCLGKCMGGGLPLAAVIGRKDILDSWRLGRAAMRPNTTAVSAALAHIQLLQDDVLQNVVDISKHILRVLKEFSERFEAVGDVRGKGLLIGVDIVKDRQSKTPGAKIAQTIRKEAFKRGLIINTTGRHEQVLTITPSLTLTKDQADTGLDILREALAAAE
jgi:4-aminobutyrate aminotransferase